MTIKKSETLLFFHKNAIFWKFQGFIRQVQGAEKIRGHLIFNLLSHILYFFHNKFYMKNVARVQLYNFVFNCFSKFIRSLRSIPQTLHGVFFPKHTGLKNRHFWPVHNVFNKSGLPKSCRAGVQQHFSYITCMVCPV